MFRHTFTKLLAESAVRSILVDVVIYRSAFLPPWLQNWGVRNRKSSIQGQQSNNVPTGYYPFGKTLNCIKAVWCVHTLIAHGVFDRCVGSRHKLILFVWVWQEWARLRVQNLEVGTRLCKFQS